MKLAKREIKFRAWDAERNQYFYSDAYGLEGFFARHADDTLEQYTGFRDKSGNDIYEGDICGLDDPEDESRFEVVWQNGAWRARYREWPSYLPEYNIMHVLPEFTIVIGNMRQNADLFECA